MPHLGKLRTLVPHGQTRATLDDLRFVNNAYTQSCRTRSRTHRVNVTPASSDSATIPFGKVVSHERTEGRAPPAQKPWASEATRRASGDKPSGRACAHEALAWHATVRDEFGAKSALIGPNSTPWSTCDSPRADTPQMCPSRALAVALHHGGGDLVLQHIDDATLGVGGDVQLLECLVAGRLPFAEVLRVRAPATGGLCPVDYVPIFLPRPKSNPTWVRSNSGNGRIRQQFGRPPIEFGKYWANLVDIGPQWVDFRQSLPKYAQPAPARFGQVRPNLAETDPNWIDFGIGSKSCHRSSNSSSIQSSSAAPIWRKSGKIRPSARLWCTSAQPGPGTNQKRPNPGELPQGFLDV